MFGIGFTEVIVILIVALILIGPSRLPEFARNIGKGVRQFQDAFNNVKRDLNEEFSEVKDLNPQNAIVKLADEVAIEAKPACPIDARKKETEC